MSHIFTALELAQFDHYLVLWELSVFKRWKTQHNYGRYQKTKLHHSEKLWRLNVVYVNCKSKY